MEWCVKYRGQSLWCVLLKQAFGLDIHGRMLVKTYLFLRQSPLEDLQGQDKDWVSFSTDSVTSKGIR